MQPMQAPPAGDSMFLKFAESAASALVGVILGFLGALTTFKTKIALTDVALKAHKEAVDKDFTAHREGVERTVAAYKDALDRALSQYAESLSGHRNTITAEAMRAERSMREALESLRKENDERHDENRAQLRLIKRQQFLTLKAVADIARVNGADKRFDDGIWKALDETREDER